MKKTSTPSHYGLCTLVAERYPVDRLINIKDMMELLNVSRVTLYRWGKRGVFIKHIKHNGRTIGWAESDYRAWLKRA